MFIKEVRCLGCVLATDEKTYENAPKMDVEEVEEDAQTRAQCLKCGATVLIVWER